MIQPNKNKKKKKSTTIVGPGVPQWQEGDAPIDLGAESMLDEITLTGDNPNLVTFQSDDPDAPGYVDSTPKGGAGGLEMITGRLNPASLWKMAKNVPRYYKQLKNIKPKDVKAAINTAKTTGKEFLKKFKKADYSGAPNPLKPPKVGGTNVAPKGGQQTIQFPEYTKPPTYGPQPKPTVTPPSAAKTEGVIDAIKNSKVAKGAKDAWNYTPERVTKAMIDRGYTAEQADIGMKILKGTSLIGGATNAVMSGSSGTDDAATKKQKNTYYLDEMGNKYKIVKGQQIYVEEDGGLYSRAQQYMQGGMQQLPGGAMQPIGGGAVEFVGNEHDEAGMGSDSGILLDPNTEVEDGETMTQVAANGGMKDYFFSNKLKAGGLTFADKHKEMINQGADQEQINWLAKMQEAKAGRNPNKIQAENGGFRRRFDPGGLRDDDDGDGIPNFQDQDWDKFVGPLDKDAAAEKSLRYAPTMMNAEEPKSTAPTTPQTKSLENFEAYGDVYDKVDKAMETAGYKPGQRADDQGAEGIARMQNQGSEGVYGEKSIGTEEGKKDFYNRNKSLLNEMGVNSWEEFNPKEMTGEFQTRYNDKLSERWDSDEQFRTELEDKGVTRDEYLSRGFSGDGASAQDGLYGEYTFSRSSQSLYDDPALEDLNVEEEEGDVIIEDVTIDPEKEDPKKPEGDNDGDGGDDGPRGVGLGQAASFLPAAMAFADTPDYMSDPEKVTPGVVFAQRQRREDLDRVDYTDKLARNTQDAAAINRAIETSGGGSSNIINKMAMYANKKKQDAQITSAETQANTQIGNQEASINANIEGSNVRNALTASTTNANNILAANQANVKNKMYVDDFNRAADAATKDRKLDAVQWGMETANTMRRDNLMYSANKDLTKAIGENTGIYDRKEMEKMLEKYYKG